MTEQEQLREWSYGRQSRLREQANAALESGRIGDSLLLSKIRSTVVDAPTLFRGMTAVPGDRILASKVGDVIKMQPSSFSRNLVTAWYFTTSWAAPTAVPVFISLMTRWKDEDFGPIHGFDLGAAIGPGQGWRVLHSFERLREVISAGCFRVLEVEPGRSGGVHLVLRQTGVYGIPMSEEFTK